MVVEVKEKGQVTTDAYAIYNGDCVKVVKGFPDESVGQITFSPPFASLFSYSDDYDDMGNCKTYDEFFVHFGFLAKELHRVLKPGRIMAVHCMDLPVLKGDTGHIQLQDFSGDIVRLFKSHGFLYHSRHCIWKDPLEAAFRTKALGLAHKQIVKDSSMCSMGIPDYILAFRKKGENPEPIRHSEGLTEYCGAREVPRNLDQFMEGVNPFTNKPWKPKENKRSHWIWQQYASPVWFDVRQGRVLPYREAKERDDLRHICPLQLDTIERCLTLWSNPGDVVLSPFAGCGSEVYTAVKMSRKGLGVELKGSYFRQMKRNLASLVMEKNAKGFLD
jgi:DNA modification methylase